MKNYNSIITQYPPHDFTMILKNSCVVRTCVFCITVDNVGHKFEIDTN